MDPRILLTVALAIIAGAQAFDVKRLPQINQPEPDHHMVQPVTEGPVDPLVLVDPYPGGYLTKDIKLGNVIEETEPESADRVRRSPKEPATGKIVVSGNARKGSSTGGRTEGQIYVGGQVRFRRSADETQENIEEQTEVSEGRVRRSPKEPARGEIEVSGHARKGASTGGRTEGQIYVGGRIRFRRSADETQEHPEEAAIIEEEEHPEAETLEHTRLRRSPKKKGQGRVIVRGEAGRTNGRNDAGVHLIGEYRFRRSADETPELTAESVAQYEDEQAEGHEQARFRRSPKKGRGRVIVRGEAGRTNGRNDAGVHLIGEYRFRRSADETPELTAESVTQYEGEQAEGHEQVRFRRSPKKGRGRVIVRGEAGRTNGRNDAGVHLIGEYRFRRSVDETPELPAESVTLYEDEQAEGHEQARFRRSPKKGQGRVIVRGEAGRTNGRNDAGIHLIGEYRFRRSADEAPELPEESVTLSEDEQAEGHEQARFRRSPKKGQGRVIVRGEAGRTNGRNDAGIHLIGEYRFRRSADEAPELPAESVTLSEDEQAEGHEQTRFRRSPKKGQGRVIVRGEAGRTNGRNDAGIHLIGEYRFRRSADAELA